MILDWDIHQGDGTQTIFFDSDQVLVMSLHRVNFYPGRDDAHPQFTGSGKGEGFNVNVAWNMPCYGSKKGKLGSNEYRHAFEEVILPITEQF